MDWNPIFSLVHTEKEPYLSPIQLSLIGGEEPTIAKGERMVYEILPNAEKENDIFILSYYQLR